MKRIYGIIIFCTLSAAFQTLPAQQGEEAIIPPHELRQMIDSIATVVESKYIDATIGKKMGDYVQQQYHQKAYQNLSYQELGKQLRKDFLEVSGDVHMNAFYSLRQATPKASLLEEIQHKAGAASNYGYVETRITQDNVGYLKVAHFTRWRFFEEAKIAATHAVRMLQHTDALVIDLRDNPGGFEDIVAHLMSHFFDGPGQELQAYYCRYEDRRRSIYLTETLPMDKLPDLPIYILINKGTGSAAESFAYMMKHLNRATLLGETTVGAGNGSTYFRISNQFMVQVATWETLNAVTNTSWEKVGVVPHIKLDSAEVEQTAFALAKEAAHKHKAQVMKDYQSRLDHLSDALEKPSREHADSLIVHAMIACEAANLYNENSINNLGYEYLMQHKKPLIAEAIFRANTLLYPTSSNVYDSYAEALARNGKLALAVENYHKAVEIGKKNQSPNLHIYQENLQKVKKELAKYN